jgi:ribonuclease PH
LCCPFLALKNHHDDHRAIKTHVAAVSLGILDDQVILDLDYNEDSSAETDLNLVMTDSLELIEIQGTGEEAPFSKEQLNEMLEVGSSAIADIIEKQKACLK